jgi:hypothetical protein
MMVVNGDFDLSNRSSKVKNPLKKSEIRAFCPVFKGC